MYLYWVRGITAALIGGTGGLVGVLVLDDILLFLPSVFGAIIAGFITAPLFGRPGDSGWAWAFCGATVATVIGSGVGAAFYGGTSLLLPAMLVIPVTIALNPISAAAWIALMGAVHLSTRMLIAPTETHC